MQEVFFLATYIYNRTLSLTVRLDLKHMIQERRSIVASNQQAVFRFVKIYSSTTFQSTITANKFSPCLPSISSTTTL